MAFKPVLGELYKKHPVCTKIHSFEVQNKIYWHFNLIVTVKFTESCTCESLFSMKIYFWIVYLYFWLGLGLGQGVGLFTAKVMYFNIP